MYPADWKEIANEIKQQAQWCCEKCGLQCIKPGQDTSKLTRSERSVYTLNVHHWNRNPSDNRKENLIALCTALCRIHVVEALMSLS